MGKFLAGLIIGIILVPVLAVLYLMSGSAPAGVNDPPFPFEERLAGTTLHARMQQEAPNRPLSSFNSVDILAGAGTYRRGCAGCHGLPDQTENRAEPKMYPSPARLFTPDGYVTDDPVGYTYWKIKNGIRMTGMPSFGDIFSDDQIWQIAAMLASADKLPPEAADTLKKPLFPPPAAPPANGGPSGNGTQSGSPTPSGNPSNTSPPTGGTGTPPTK
jgi:thiosulfate dehydrogenase